MPGLGFGSLAGGWHGLARFWALVVVLLVAGGVTLQVLGPPQESPTQPLASAPAAAVQHLSGQPAPQPAKPTQPVADLPPPQRPGRDKPGPVLDPDPGLLEPVAGSTTDLLPRIADDGRMPMQVYAAGFDSSTLRPRVGLLLAGVGLNEAASEAAIHTLPGGVTLAFSPYATHLTRLLADARLAEHEYLLSIPMEPQGFPLNDPGPQALMTNLSPEQNQARLEWALSRIKGYVGVTNALGSLRGERFASLSDEMQPVLAEIARRGLLYVDARPGAASLPLVWDRSIDAIIDEPGSAAEIDAKLAQLSRLAREKGSALGLVTAVRPVTIQRIADWANGLIADGLALAPVSALVQAPAKGAGQ